MTHSTDQSGSDRPAIRLALWSACAALPLIAGVPQISHAAEEGLSLLPDPERLFLSFVVLALLIYPVQRLLLGPLAEILQQRSLQTVGAISEAERQAAEAREIERTIEERLAAARKQGQTRRAAALAEAEAVERHSLARAREEAARKIESMRSLLAAETSAARTALPAVAKELAGEAAAKLLGRAL